MYQRMVNNIFKYKIEKNIVVYVNDMIVKSKTTDLHLIDFSQNIWGRKEVKHAPQSNQMHLQSQFEKVPQIHHVLEENKCKS